MIKLETWLHDDDDDKFAASRSERAKLCKILFSRSWPLVSRQRADKTAPRRALGRRLIKILSQLIHPPGHDCDSTEAPRSCQPISPDFAAAPDRSINRLSLPRRQLKVGSWHRLARPEEHLAGFAVNRLGRRPSAQRDATTCNNHLLARAPHGLATTC